MINELLLKKYGLKKDSRVIIKINLAEKATPQKPKADARLLHDLVNSVIDYCGECAICECAQGQLTDYLYDLGFSQLIEMGRINVIDLDEEPDDQLTEVSNEYGTYLLPKCLLRYDFRIALATASKRERCIYSNCVKLFVGIIPYRTLQLYNKIFYGWRPAIHMDLHNNVCGIFEAVMKYAPFHLFISGGNAYQEGRGMFNSPVYASNDAIAIDFEVLQKEFGIPTPLYLKLLSNKSIVSGDKTALLLIDVQNDYCSENGYYAKKDTDLSMNRVANNIIQSLSSIQYDYLLRSAMQYRKKDYANEPCIEGSYGAEFYFDTISDFDFVKWEFSCFSNEDLCAYLKKHSVKRIKIAGFQTSFCIYSTALDAIKLGYDVDIIRSCICDRPKHKKNAENKIELLKTMGCNIVD